jgi:prepilin-type N-terminal cleavage/methylation domain-containing protein
MKTLPHHRRNAFTLIELLTVIAITGILASILIPVVGSVRKSAQLTLTSSNLRQMGTAMALFLADNYDVLPGHSNDDRTAGLVPGVTPTIWMDNNNLHHRQRLAYHIGPYLQTIRRGENNIEVIMDSYTRSQSQNPPGVNMTIWVLNHRLTAGGYPQLSGDFFPFGNANTLSPASYGVLSETLPPTRTWAITSADRRIPETSHHTPNTVNSSPSEPIAGSFRYALFFDWSIGRIPVEADLRTIITQR